MTGKKVRFLIILFIVFTFCTCIDPYFPRLNGSESFLVVDGLVTDQNASYCVKLTRTMQSQDLKPAMEVNAAVTIRDNAGNKSVLKEVSQGIYKTDSTLFKGVIGSSYTLNIKTSDGIEYESESCMMQPVQEIDTLYFSRDQELSSNGNETVDGIRIFLDSKDNTDCRYFRWEYEESWKFKMPDPVKFKYYNDSTIVPLSIVREYCWKSNKSNETVIQSIESGQTDRIRNKPIAFIASGKSDRLMIQYSILVKQYSLSKKEYDFWNNLKQISESGGDIFEKQPYSVISNIHNVNNPKEQVLGYFQVSALEQKRKYIRYSEIAGMDLPLYQNACQRFEAGPGDYLLFPMTFDKIYKLFVDARYTFVEPKYSFSGELQKLVFATPVCSDCSLTGNPDKPDFWIDLN